jgi:hypothetical protein
MILVAVVVAGLLPVAVVAVAAVVSERSAVVLADFLGIPVSTALLALVSVHKSIDKHPLDNLGKQTQHHNLLGKH